MPGSIELRAGDVAGLRYGAVTLVQLIHLYYGLQASHRCVPPPLRVLIYLCLRLCLYVCLGLSVV